MCVWTLSGAELPAPRPLFPEPAEDVGEPVDFAWSEVEGAAAYGIQIADSREFRVPLLLDQKVPQSYLAGPALPRGVQPWWRVRAIDAAGVPGPWSPPRRFRPIAPPLAPALFSVMAVPVTVAGGYGVQGKVKLVDPAPEGGATVELRSSDPAATLPDHVIVPAGGTSADFPIATSEVPENRPIRIVARSELTTRTVMLTVTPPPTPGRLSSLSFQPGMLVAGGVAHGTIMLSDIAAPPGATVRLDADDRTVAELPTSVIVPAGQRSAAFDVRAIRPTLPKIMTVTASLGGATRSAVLNLMAAASASPLPPPQLLHPGSQEWVGQFHQVTFNWSSVPGAASYTVEVDTASTFASPAMVVRSVQSTEVTIGPFSRETFWWRVCANDSSGAPGAWSPMRRFGVE